jgi:hypothetical protein
MLILYFGPLKGHFTPLLRPRRNKHPGRAVPHDLLAQHANCGLYFGKSENGNDVAISQMRQQNTFGR